LAFQYLMENKTICINEGELIVGEKGTAPKATPTYPELCCHSMQDLQILNDREKTPFAASDEVRRVYREKIIPFWSGKTMREKIFRAMDQAWLNAYEAGMFTEFMEQRSPGHTVLDNKIYRKGMLDFKQDIQQSLDHLDFLNDPQAYAKQQELKAMLICGTRSSGSRSATRRGPGSWRDRNLIHGEEPNWSGSPRSVRTFRPTRRATSGRRCNTTGSSTWASRPR
jgi:formate C-acetyltransferase